MKLYHYTGADHIVQIMSDGLTMGGLLVSGSTATGGLRVAWGWRWLTDEACWTEQRWATDKTGRCGDRTEYRIRVSIPKSARQHLFRWAEVRRSLPSSTAEDLESVGGHEHWWLFNGNVPRSWLRIVERNPLALPVDPRERT